MVYKFPLFIIVLVVHFNTFSAKPYPNLELLPYSPINNMAPTNSPQLTDAQRRNLDLTSRIVGNSVAFGLSFGQLLDPKSAALFDLGTKIGWDTLKAINVAGGNSNWQP